MTEQRSAAPAGKWLNPATERLLSKYTSLDEALQVLKAQPLAEEQKTIANICETYLGMARNYIDRPFWSGRFPYLERKHPHLVWELLHRVDEYFILLTKEKELYSRALDVKTSFDLNIREATMRKEWIGEEGKEGKFKEILEEIGYTVLSAATPQEAVSLCEDKDTVIDLLLTDVVMPGMSGKELKKAIEVIRPGINVLFMSGYTSNVIAHRGVLEKGVHFIQKPFSMKDLAQKVREAIGER